MGFAIYATTILSAILVIAYMFCKYRYTYWQKEKIPYLEPTVPFGNLTRLIFQQDSFGDIFKSLYFQVKDKSKSFVGFYQFLKPSIMLVDPELVKNVLSKDFSHFHDRPFYIDEKSDPLSGNLVSLRGLRWKNSRNKLTQTFTSGKMKMMFHIMKAASDELTKVIDKQIEVDEPVDTKNVFSRLSIDIIGSCAFGLDCNSLENPNAEFRKYGIRAFDFGLRETLFNVAYATCPSLLTFFRIPQNHPDVINFYMGVLKETVEYREKNNIHRKDFLDLLIRLKNNQSLGDDQLDKIATSEGMTFNELASHAFIFLVGGFETTSSTMNFCVFELSSNPKIQEKVRKEVVEVLGRHNNEFTYEAIMEMKYMDKVINEVLRKYPPFPFLNRDCNENYQVPGSSYVIKQGMEIVISTIGMHYDAEHFPNPEKFDPERFSEEEKAKRHPYTYLPFGDGPRNCIGLRFALLQIKLVLAVLLKKYKFTLHSKTVLPMKFSTQSLTLSPKDTVWIKIQKLQDS